jgi:thermitase
VDQAATGAPYVAGELLVAYEPGTPTETKRAVVRETGGRTVKDIPGRVRLVSFPGIRRAESGKAREQALHEQLEVLRDRPHVAAADYNYLRRASFVPNDPRFDAQWGLKKDRFPGAWTDSRGAGAKIAVVDSGIDRAHPDIGKISAQKDLVNGDAVADERYEHGTHVAGIAAALTNNGRGVAGGCPGCRLLVAKVLDSRGITTDADAVAGIGWSVNHGADVVNLSFSGGGRSGILEAAIDHAKGSGAVVVAAAGNKGTNVPQYPAAYPAAIAVSATNANDTLAGFSSRGNWVDLSAPGTNILSTVGGGGYGEESGTSESAPFVSALAGLLASQGKSADQIRLRMQSTATDLGPEGDDPKFGHGRIDAARAVR